MLASINPLGERARNNRWWLTAAAYVVASAAGGAAVGAAAAGLGRAVALLVAPGSVGPVAAVAAAACWLAAAADLTGRSTSGPRRQVNEDWLGAYRGWVYGAGFGVQLGAGVFTIVTTATVYLAFGLALLCGLSGSPVAGVAVGAVFGLSRAAPVAATGRFDRPEALRRFHRRMQRALPAANRLAAATAAAAGAAIAAGVGARLG